MTNDNGEFEYEFKFYVTVEGGMDFRAMLMKRKVKQKKIVQKVIEWIEVFLKKILINSKVIFRTHVYLKKNKNILWNIPINYSVYMF